MSREKIISLILIVFVYAVTASGSYLFFSKSPSSADVISNSPAAQVDKDGKIVFDQSLPRTEECPLNGAMYPEIQRQWWETHRPLGVMIENHEESRPQSGLSRADVVYEVVAEGGITRFLAVYHCQDAGTIGPIRSARTYFLDFISEYGNSPLYAHVGGANTPGPANALGQIIDYGWAGYNDLNQFSVGFPTFWRDTDRLGGNVATEHTMYSTTGKLWEYAELKGLKNVDKNGVVWHEDFVEYEFAEEENPSSESQTIHLEFWSGYPEYYVDWIYDPSKNVYNRETGGVPHVDFNNDEQLSAKNIVVVYMRESRANDGYPDNIHLLYGTKGSGNAEIFMNGQRILGTWSKDSRIDRLMIYDDEGNEIEFSKGTIWFEILPELGVVDVS